MRFKKHYFEGWYFKQKCGANVISFIPGISSNDGVKHAFIQVISTAFHKPLYIKYPYEKLSINKEPLEINIDNNRFSLEGIEVDILYEDIRIQGKLSYTSITPIHKSIFSPSIMGPFSYLPFMECNHGILSLNHNVDGQLNVNLNGWNFAGGKGYIEKDWGKSFPKSWTWIQCNDFDNHDIASVIIAIADIPYLGLQFPGLIAIFYQDGKEYRFATYNGGKVLMQVENNGIINITIKKGALILELKTEMNKGGLLKAPVRGDMSRLITECVSCNVHVKLSNKNRILFEGDGHGAGVEKMN